MHTPEDRDVNAFFQKVDGDLAQHSTAKRVAPEQRLDLVPAEVRTRLDRTVLYVRDFLGCHARAGGSSSNAINGLIHKLATEPGLNMQFPEDQLRRNDGLGLTTVLHNLPTLVATDTRKPDAEKNGSLTFAIGRPGDQFPAHIHSADARYNQFPGDGGSFSRADWTELTGTAAGRLYRFDDQGYFHDHRSGDDAVVLARFFALQTERGML